VAEPVPDNRRWVRAHFDGVYGSNSKRISGSIVKDVVSTEIKILDGAYSDVQAVDGPPPDAAKSSLPVIHQHHVPGVCHSRVPATTHPRFPQAPIESRWKTSDSMTGSI